MATRSVTSATIFISYRREDTGGDAGRLNETLTQLLGPGRTFLDVEKIAPGKDFRNELKRVLGASDILLALIGSKWETIADANGRQRLSDKDDFVRMELLAGLRNKSVRVVPILLNRETLPKATDLPSDLGLLIKRNAFTIRRDRWHQDVKELLKRLRVTRKRTSRSLAASRKGRQASLVSVSVEWKRNSIGDLIPRRWVVYIYNASDAPITVKRVVVTSPETELSIDWGTIEPKVLSDYELDEADFEPCGDRPDVFMQFFDAKGQKWTLRKGLLKRVR